jgi:hypothetical protein
MSVAQTQAARRLFRSYYGKPIIGRPHYKTKSAAKLARREAEKAQKMRDMMSRKGKKKG